MICTYYQIKYRKITDTVVKWYTKATCRTKAEAERFIDVLERVSDVYAELKIEPVTVNLEGKKK